MNVKRKMLGIVVFAAFLSSAYHSQHAEARSQPAFLGQARIGSDVACFYEKEAGPIQAYCAQDKDWFIPIVSDHGGLLSPIRVTARGAQSGTKNVTCRSYSLSEQGAFSIGGSKKTVLNTGGLEKLDLSMTHPSLGAVWVTCTMAQGTRLAHVYYP